MVDDNIIIYLSSLLSFIALLPFLAFFYEITLLNLI